MRDGVTRICETSKPVCGRTAWLPRRRVVGDPRHERQPEPGERGKDHWRHKRVIAWSIAFWLVLLSCLPKFAGLIVNMPRPVMAAALFFNGALMLVAGMQIIASRPITLRATLVIGFSILAAMTVAIYPEFYRSLPSWTQQFTGSIISVAVIVAVPLNALFLLGTWNYSQLLLGRIPRRTAGSFNIFFEKQAKEWKILRRMRRACAPSSIRRSNMSRPMPMGRWKSKWGAIRSTSW